jgi:hypothetical protein
MDGTSKEETKKGIQDNLVQSNYREKNGVTIIVIHLAQDRDCWQALVNMVMNLQVLAPYSELTIIVSSTYAEMIIGSECISGGVMKIGILMKEKKMNILQIYAPQTGCSK